MSKDNSFRISESDQMSIRAFKKELRLSLEIYNGRFGGVCSKKNCNIDFRMLPALEFHHINPELKISMWSDLMHKEYNHLKSELESQNVVLLCNNCHLMEGSTIFNEYEFLIMKQNLFSYTAEEIDKLIDNYTNDARTKFEIKRWIKKRSVVDQLFDNKCIGCDETRLPTLQFHHIDEELKRNKWKNVVRSWTIKKIIKKFILEEECICLCANCHSMIGTPNFEKYLMEILEIDEFTHIEQIKDYYFRLNQKIGSYTDKIRKIKQNLKKPTFKDHLKLMVSKGEVWKRVLIHVYYIINFKKLNEISVKELEYSLDVNPKTVRRDFLPGLIERDLIRVKRIYNNAYIYELTPNGKNFAYETIQNWSRNHQKAFNELIKEIKVINL